MKYKEAMERYGSDKPDIRFELELKDISDIGAASDFSVFKSIVKNGGMIKGINAKGGSSFSRKEIESELTKFVGIFGAKGLAWMKVSENGLESNIVKFFPKEQQKELLSRFDAKPGDLLLFVADKEKVVNEALGNLRNKLGEKLGLIDEDELKFLWVTDFPLFLYNEETKRWDSVHHPFTAPSKEDMDKLDSDIGAINSDSYDIILNGVELGGGSIRIHTPELQSKIFEILGISKEEAEEKFGFLLEAFNFGAPPHGGIALGFDRFVMIMQKEKTLREVIAFPKTQKGTCPISDAPGNVSNEQLRDLFIKVTETAG